MNPITHRVKHLLMLLFADIQQREAARQIGVTQSLLSRTLSEEREPSKTLLEKLASFSGVNPRWLLDGVGEPLLSDCTSLPVVTRLPKTADASWQEAVAGEDRFRVSQNQFSETRYWCRLTKSALKNWSEWGQQRLRVKDGDYLLLETDPRQIQSLPGRTRVVVVTHPEVAKGKPTWGILFSDMRFFTLKAGSHPNQAEQPVNAMPKRVRRKIKRPGNDAELVSSDPLRQMKRSGLPSEVVVKPEEVMAVVLEMTSDSLTQKASD